ncbi:hypothetical protein CEXT_368341 [Caerostris extrusa]|uniref:Uncharacterized protein n=1 Tax=Caerostris extrusa TaxID=172846 RepID=A0AAV4WI26_CAEEX|nr:hypothetical protein CEXT_368341 [Caerostris extrusa]
MVCMKINVRAGNFNLFDSWLKGETAEVSSVRSFGEGSSSSELIHRQKCLYAAWSIVSIQRNLFVVTVRKSGQRVFIRLLFTAYS